MFCCRSIMEFISAWKVDGVLQSLKGVTKN
jgi:hypothetical protein